MRVFHCIAVCLRASLTLRLMEYPIPNSESMFWSSSDANMDPMFSSMGLQTLLSLNPSLFPTLSSLTDHPPPPTPTPTPIPTLLVPKHEYPPSSFFQLHSTPPQKRFRVHDPPTATTLTAPFSDRGKPPSLIPQSNLARLRRQKLSDKTRCLQKLMPWDKKMDQATLLEEAHKYVKFLQAQLLVLQSMPASSNSSCSVMHGGGGVFGDLERLNRNQVLRVLVNSPVAQTMLCSQGFCVFSAEQLALLRKLNERKLLLQHLSDHASSSSSKSFFN